jgi:hypothetical protein
MSVKVIAEVDEKEYGLLCKPSEVEPLMKALRSLYSIIWPEACYDALNKDTEKFAQDLLPWIQQVNDILGFKK